MCVSIYRYISVIVSHFLKNIVHLFMKQKPFSKSKEFVIVLTSKKLNFLNVLYSWIRIIIIHSLKRKQIFYYCIADTAKIVLTEVAYIYIFVQELYIRKFGVWGSQPGSQMCFSNASSFPREAASLYTHTHTHTYDESHDCPRGWCLSRGEIQSNPCSFRLVMYVVHTVTHISLPGFDMYLPRSRK